MGNRGAKDSLASSGSRQSEVGRAVQVKRVCFFDRRCCLCVGIEDVMRRTDRCIAWGTCPLHVHYHHIRTCRSLQFEGHWRNAQLAVSCLIVSIW